jgi:peptidyl-prolyl cis-trans isomerase D
MLATLRRFANTWPARVLFVLLCGSFGLWGVAGMLGGSLTGGDPNSVATVGSQKIDPQDLQDVSRRMLAQMMQQSGSTAAPTPEMRRGVAEQALQQLVVQASFAAEVARLNVQVPDEALRRATFETRAFQGPNGQFDRATFNTVLRNNNYTEARYLSLMRTDLAQRQVAEAVRAGGYSSDLVNRLVFTFQGETRTADLVSLPFAAAAEPPAPTDEQLQRQYDDNANDYRAPEYRRVKMVILSPEGVAKDITVSDDDAKAYYASHKADFSKPETRSVEVVVAQTEAAAKTLANAWLTGADWDAIQKQASAANASAIALDDTTQAAFPSPELAAPVFAAAANAITGPVNAEGSWAVFRVTKVAGGSEQPFEAHAAEIKQRMALDQATDQVYDRANKVQDLLAGGAKLDELPAGLGLLAVTGTMDAQGNTPDGTPAPIPAAPPLRQAIITKAFALAPTDPATLEDGPDHSFYAVTVDAITPPAQQPFDAVKDRVRDDWLRDARRHEQDLAATALLTAVEGGTSLKDAAEAAKLPMTRSPPIGRTTPPPGIPAQLVQPLFATDVGHATMVESPTGFVVAVTVAITKPDPATDTAGLDRVRLALSAATSDDLEMTYAAALRTREKVVVNRQLFDSIAQ